MAQFDVNGIKLNCEIAGNGFPLLLVHGVGMSLEQWSSENFLEKLAQKHTVIAFDCRGHGASEKPARYTLEDHADDVVGLLDVLGIGQADLLGHSMGSYIAQRVAFRAPQRIRKLLLIAPKSHGLTSSVERILSENADKLAVLDQPGREQFVNRFVFYSTEVLKRHPDAVRSFLPPEALKAAHAALKGFDFRGELGKITATTLVISGRHDGLNPPAEGRACADGIPAARFVEMPFSGHVPQIEEAEATFQIVEEFLSEL